MSMQNERGAELLDDIARKVAGMARVVLPEERQSEAESFGRRVADMLADDWGGISVYFPKSASSRFQRRNADLFADYTGRNMVELAKKYGLSEQRIYAILKEERARRRVRQMVFPGFSL